MKQKLGEAITFLTKITSILQLQWLRRFLPPKRFAIFEACLIGLVTGISAILLRIGTGWLGTWRVHSSYILPAWLVLPAIGLFFGFVAGTLIERLAPEAYNGGIIQVKAALSGSTIALDLRVAFVKFMSALLVVSSGMPLGWDEPVVHISSAFSAQISHWISSSASQRRYMIAVGAGAGLAAAFNAPITGILFVGEGLLQDLSGLSLGTAIIASFIGAVVFRLFGGRSLQLNLELIESTSSFTITELPFYLFLGISAGLLAALFRKGLLLSLSYYRKLPVGLPLRIALAGLISGIIIAVLPETFRINNTGLRQFINTGDLSVYRVALVFTAQFILTLVAFGSGAPGGLFAPSLILGSCLGYLVGFVEFQILGISSPNTYALVGMGAFFSAVFRVPITAIMIIFEITNDFNLVLPLMIGSVVAYWIAESIASGSIYDAVLALNNNYIEGELINPFQYGNPLSLNRAYLFKGRISFTNQVVQLVLDRSRPTVVLYGPRRVGKSSFLLNLLHLLPQNILPVYINLQSAAITNDEPSFCFSLVRSISRDSRGLGIELPPIPKLNEFRTNPYILLEEWLDEALPLLGSRSVMLNLDEFEKLGSAIADGRLSLRLFDELRSLIQHYEQLRFLLSGVQTLNELGPNWSSYFISVVPIEMVYLERNEAFELLINPDPQFNLRYRAGIIDKIITLTRCHPYLLQLIGASIVNQASLQHTRRVNFNLLETAIEEALTTGEPYFMNVWTEFTGNSSAEIAVGQELLLALARDSKVSLVANDEVIQVVLGRLQRYHIIEHISGNYNFEVPLFKRWVRERAVQN
ncbi:chloride channel protein [Calothrix sp. CCY 0018]|uniref:chloride channel protein n=1 Tax=Calothrix sp. CCY 0018 TaxID=3103864 RepID=UPI0039C5E6AA